MDLFKMSAKGQVVIPEEIRKRNKYEPGDHFFIVETPEGLLLKRADLRKSYDAFRKLCKDAQREVKKSGIPVSVVDEAVRWARKKQS